jgi:hypothetical protein
MAIVARKDRGSQMMDDASNMGQEGQFMIHPYAEAFWTESGAKERAEIINRRLYERHLLARVHVVYQTPPDEIYVVAVVFLVLPSQLGPGGSPPRYIDAVLAGRGGKPVHLQAHVWEDIIQDAMGQMRDTQGLQLEAMGRMGAAEIDPSVFRPMSEWPGTQQPLPTTREEQAMVKQRNLARIERLLDLTEDLDSSDEEKDRVVGEMEPGDRNSRAEDIIDLCRRRIAGWQPPSEARTPEEKQVALESYTRLRRLASFFAGGMRSVWRKVNMDLGDGDMGIEGARKAFIGVCQDKADSSDVRANDVINTYRQHIANWQTPGDAHTPEEKQAALESYYQLGGLVHGLEATTEQVVERLRRS